ncbi:hypothetical protein [Pseudomonas beijingensis]|uniref:hypothetical protein n=1 Tax=Pseudomonas beijingensis TaxID=2954101 RepID=UPI0027332681|nr:hypothetical protein [Pseudomonas sp. FP2262]WLH45334.1 hypothetical protein PSH83_23725 [Pseudomonas sp. FP2262]
MQQEKNILVNRGIPQTIPLSSHGFGSNWDHSKVTINADLGRAGVDLAVEWVIENNTHSEKTYRENIKNIFRITDTDSQRQEQLFARQLKLEPTRSPWK